MMPTPPTPRRHAGPLVAALVLVGSVMTAAVTFGVERPPALAAVADTDALPAGLAWTEHRGLTADTCLSVLDPAGDHDRVGCEAVGNQLVGWTDEGIATIEWGGDVVADDGTVTESWLLRHHDPTTGAVLDEHAAADHGWYDIAGELAVWTDREDGQLVVAGFEINEPTVADDDDGAPRLGGDERIQVEGNDAAVLWRVDAPPSYDVYGGALSPDRQWVVLTDNAGRLVVVPADGSGTARVWADGVDVSAGPIWHGTPVVPIGDVDD